jgi:hypothetical protein
MQTLTRWSRRAKSAQVLAMRSKIILACAERASNTDVAKDLGVHLSTVGKWRRRFLTLRLDGLTVHLDQDRRRDPRITRTILWANFRRRTLAIFGRWAWTYPSVPIQFS